MASLPWATASDLVKDSKLDARVKYGLTIETRHTHSADNHGSRPIRVEELWRRRHRVGLGSSSVVWLEACESGPRQNQFRVVKEILKKSTPNFMGSVMRELEAAAKFSQPKVGTVPFNKDRRILAAEPGDLVCALLHQNLRLVRE